MEYKRIRNSIIHKANLTYSGIASLQTVLRYYGYNQSFQELYKCSGTSKNGTSITGLFEVAAKYNMEVEGGKADIAFLKAKKEPLILYVKINNRSAYLVTWGFNDKKQRFIITNPARGDIEEVTERELELIWKSHILLLIRPKNLENEAVGIIIPSYLNWLSQFVKEDLRLLTLVLVLIIIRSVLIIYAIFILGTLLSFAENENITFLLSKLLLSLLVVFFFEYIQQFLLIRQGDIFKNNLISNFFSNIFYSSRIEQDRYSISLLTTHLKDISVLQRILAHNLPSIISYAILEIFCMSSLFFFHWSIGVMVGFCFATIWLQYQEVTKDKWISSLNGLYKSTVELLVNITTKVEITNISTEIDKLFVDFKSSFKTYYDLEAGRKKDTIKKDFFIRIIFSVWLIGFIYACLYQQIDNIIVIFCLVAVIIILILQIIKKSDSLAQGKIAYENIVNLIILSPTIIEKRASKVLPFEFESLKLSKFSFAPFGSNSLLENINIDIRKGEIINIRGAIGEGKSTLLNLIYRINNITDNSVLINGQEAENVNFKQWYNSVAIVEQVPKLLEGRTIVKNILMGEDIEEVEEIMDFLTTYNLSGYFNLFPYGLATYIGDEGIPISNGQKKILSMARALWKKPQLLLLDEPTNGLDDNTKSFIIDLILKIKPQMGIIVASNDKDWLKHADKTYKLENKKLISIKI